MMHPDTLAAVLAALRAELQAPEYSGKTAAEIVALLNAPVVVAPEPQPRSFRWREVKAIAQGAGEWPRVVVRARQTPAMPPSTATDAAILAAINAVSMEADQVLDGADEVEAAAFATGIAALVATGDLSQGVAGRIAALAVETLPVVTQEPRWSVIISGISGAEGMPGPPNAATEALVMEAINANG